MPCNDVETADSIEHDHDYESKPQPLPESFFGNNKEHNRIISFSLGNSIIMKNLKTSLNSKEINICDISSKPEENNNKRLLLLGTQIGRYSGFLKCYNCQEKTIKPKPMEKCSKCPRYIHVPRMRFHLEKHKRDELKNLTKTEKKVSKPDRREAFVTCRTCNEKCESKDELHDHLSKHPPYVCEKCGEGFVKAETLKAHVITHNDPNSFLCEFCGKGFKHKSFLRSHLLVHTTHKFKCQHCPKLFKHQMHVKKHIKNTHFKTYNSQCVYCGKQFVDRGRCNYHIRLVHLKVKPFECNICYKKFGRPDYLRIHKLNHTGEPRLSWKMLRYKKQDNGKPVHCKLCKKLLKNMTCLKRHLETHVKRYTCQFCSLSFARKALWQKHELIHEGGTVDFFRCNTCWKRFNSKEALEEHTIIHDKPRYSCDICKKTFNRRFLLNHHKFDHINAIDAKEANKIIFDSLLEVAESSDPIGLIKTDIK